MQEILLKEYLLAENADKFVCKRLSRGLFVVWGKESVQFLNGLITNDVKTLQDNEEMLAAFPNAQGRLLGVVRVRKQNDKFYFETEEATREKIFQNLFRFTFAGDFFVEDLSDKYQFYWVADSKFQISNSEAIHFGNDVFIPKETSIDLSKAIEVSDELYEILRIERGNPLYGVDIDETTIVPEIGLENLISYKKGCYIGQEIIARIYFRGHIAKQFIGLVLSNSDVKVGDELKSAENKNAGKITSVTYSPKLEKHIALGFVRYDYLTEGTELLVNDTTAIVKNLPFIN